MILLVKTWKIWLPLLIAVGVFTAGTMYVNHRVDKALTEYKTYIEGKVQERVNADKKLIREAFKGGNSDAITNATDGLLSEYIQDVTAASTTGGNTRSTKGSARVTKERTRHSEVGTDHGLSAMELGFIEKHLHNMSN